MGACSDVGWLGYWELSCGLVVVGSFIGYRCLGQKLEFDIEVTFKGAR